MSDDTTPIERLTRELVHIGGPLATLAYHMSQQAAAGGRDPSEVPDVLAELVEPTIEGITEGWPEERILDAAAVLHAACERVCSEIMIVVPPPSRAQRRGLRRPR
jgi:hypothetical protein